MYFKRANVTLKIKVFSWTAFLPPNIFSSIDVGRFASLQRRELHSTSMRPVNAQLASSNWKSQASGCPVNLSGRMEHSHTLKTMKKFRTEFQTRNKSENWSSTE